MELANNFQRQLIQGLSLDIAYWLRQHHLLACLKYFG